MFIYPLADITGNGAAHALSSDPNIRAKWVQITADPANGAAVRIGGSTTASGVGFPLAKGQTLLLPQDPTDVTSFYYLNSIKYYAANSDKLYVLYGAG